MAEPTNPKYCTHCALSLLQPTEALKTRTDRVEELLHQNHPPLDVELPAFREIVETTPAALQDLDSKIVQARELLDNLLSARQHVLSHFEDAKALLHPMRSIPNEILANIFEHCIVKLQNNVDPDTLDPRAAPWLLTGVCRRWRNLAINSPQLWTHLLLDFDKQRGYITGRQCAYKVGLFNQRSRGFPMTVYLGSVEDDVTDHSVLPCLEVSLPCWKSLHVDVAWTSLQCLSGNIFSNLRKLVLVLPSDASEWDVNLDVFHATRVPALREFGADTECPLGAPLKHVALPWAQLTRVFNILVDADGLDYFAEMTNVQELEVVLSDDYTPSERTISLPKLRRLSILEKETAGPGYATSFFSILTMPSISELELDFPDKDEHLCLFPTLNTAGLEKLVKITCSTSLHDDNTNNLLDFLSLTHRVEELRIHDDDMPVDLFTGLTFSESSDSAPPRLPCLRILDIRRCTCDDILADDISPIFDMLESRMMDLEEKNVTQDVNIPQLDSSVPGNIPHGISLRGPTSVSLES